MGTEEIYILPELFTDVDFGSELFEVGSIQVGSFLVRGVFGFDF